MYTIPLTQVPNQAIAFNVDDAYWQIHVYQAVERMYADITLNGEVIIRAVRCLSGIFLLPYEYLHLPRFGNFIFDADVDWNDFNTKCFLYYLTVDEYAAYKAMGALTA